MPTIIEIDIDPERKFSNGSDWDNSIDWDDASDGSDGGYTLHDNYIHPDAMKEIIKLRIDNYNKDQRIKELENSLKNIEEYVDGLVRVHCQFAEAAKGSWSGKKQRVRAAEASQILAFIRKQKIREGN